MNRAKNRKKGWQNPEKGRKKEALIHQVAKLEKILKKTKKVLKKGLTNEKECGILIGRHGEGDQTETSMDP